MSGKQKQRLIETLVCVLCIAYMYLCGKRTDGLFLYKFTTFIPIVFAIVMTFLMRDVWFRIILYPITIFAGYAMIILRFDNQNLIGWDDFWQDPTGPIAPIFLVVFLLILHRKLVGKPEFITFPPAKEPTTVQYRWDIIFGILLPLICLIADPVVFKTWTLRDVAFLGSFRTVCYLIILIGIIIQSYVLIRHPCSVVLAGILFAGSIFSFALGYFLLPVSIIGLIMVIGIFGFIPFFTSFVLLRNAYRVFRNSFNKEQSIQHISICGIIFIIALFSPILVQVTFNDYLHNQVEIILHGTPDEAKDAGKILKRFQLIDDKDVTRDIAFHTFVETNSTKLKLVSDIYKDITGETLMQSRNQLD